MLYAGIGWDYSDSLGAWSVWVRQEMVLENGKYLGFSVLGLHWREEPRTASGWGAAGEVPVKLLVFLGEVLLGFEGGRWWDRIQDTGV